MIRFYGDSPYKIVLIHGGPGDIGSLKACAKEVENRTGIGVIEPLQSKYSILELIDELYLQIKDNIEEKAILIGHSWGAWLAALLTEKYPDIAEKLVLVGCPPLKDKYVREITDRRLNNLSCEDCVTFHQLKDITCNSDMKKMQSLIEKSDNYCLFETEQAQPLKCDSKMYSMIWPEAAKLRSNGALLTAFSNIKCKIYLIQGEVDPHPANGVIIPLSQIGVDCRTYILPQCGHSPFRERYANMDFYNALINIICN